MCYQTRIIKKKNVIEKRFNAIVDKVADITPMETIKAFDYPKTPIITNDKPQAIQLYNWGLVPENSFNLDIRQYTLNARIESLHEKKSFKNYTQNRCLIIADGFYEWQWLNKSGSQKQKYLLTISDEELFAVAGLYSTWTSLTGEVFQTYTMVTTQANELMTQIHNTKHRMPVILKQEDEEAWLQGSDYHKFEFPYSIYLVATPIHKNPNQTTLF